jgi:predicted nucleic acid-binding protein
MTFDDIPDGEAVFLDANPFLHYFTAHARYGAVAQRLIDRIENQIIVGYTAAHVLLEVVHRLMTIEACQRFVWPVKRIAQRMRQHPAEVQLLDRSRQAFDELSMIGLKVLAITKTDVSLGIDASRQTGLLSADALIIALMRQHNLTGLASEDSDFDRVSGITRYGPT